MHSYVISAKIIAKTIAYWINYYRIIAELGWNTKKLSMCVWVVCLCFVFLMLTLLFYVLWIWRKNRLFYNRPYKIIHVLFISLCVFWYLRIALQFICNLLISQYLQMNSNKIDLLSNFLVVWYWSHNMCFRYGNSKSQNADISIVFNIFLAHRINWSFEWAI